MKRTLFVTSMLWAAAAFAQPCVAANTFDGGIQIFNNVTNWGPFQDFYPLQPAGNNNGYLWRIHTPQEGRGGGDWMLSWVDSPGWDGGAFSGDSVLEYGYNIHQPETDKPQWSINLESYFQDLSEFHLAWTGPSDGTWVGKPNPRVISSAVVNSTGHADIGHQVDRFYLQDATGANQPFVVDMTSTDTTVSLNNGAYLFFSKNNYTPLYQTGADGTARALLYLDNGERVQLAPWGSAGLPADTTISDTGGNNRSGLTTATYAGGSATTATYGMETGATTLSGGAATVALHFSSGAPVCTCSDQTAVAACSPGTPSSSSMTLAGTGTHVLAWRCTGPK